MSSAWYSKKASLRYLYVQTRPCSFLLVPSRGKWQSWSFLKGKMTNSRYSYSPVLTNEELKRDWEKAARGRWTHNVWSGPIFEGQTLISPFAGMLIILYAIKHMNQFFSFIIVTTFYKKPPLPYLSQKYVQSAPIRLFFICFSLWKQYCTWEWAGGIAYASYFLTHIFIGGIFSEMVFTLILLTVFL